ncbi:hypothetical protein [Aliivibrio fischeri]|uniref:Uncharacterized protein n=1 Tax=Aliivibrio fischeri TaxID=668 RepID=A0A510UR48_ALIFS|nr:hypothetical protein [Aliivibrio fischeri]MUK51223.1 hypothetical protein [Aliivibrio fischeri]GEK15921.1 hypothetical protein AFI02nite_39570 [Aliivibrio fischeri]
MKKTFLAITTLVSLSMTSIAMATALPTGSSTLQWAGSVPAESLSGKGYWIVQDGGVGLTEGILTFSNDADGITLNSSSEIGFKVVEDLGSQGVYEPSMDITPMQYSYTLTNVKVGINGIATTQNPEGYFAVYADGNATASKIGTAVEKATGLPTRLSIKGNGTPSADLFSSGDDVVVMAVVSVTPDSAAITL